MRYTQEHKAEIHRQILAEASLRFRRDGVAATGVQTLMNALGLTHGAFYAHFPSKDALVEEVLRSGTEPLDATFSELFARRDALPAFIDHYLAKGHRDTPGTGCPLPTISAELAARGQPSAESDRIVRDRLERIEQALSGNDATDAAAASIALLSTLVGALQLSRSVADPALSDRILEGARRWLGRRFSS
jgi:AcrR family transcriptional regulator